ncbi:MAG TPA: hypothetical protein VEI80_02770 [Candidatus Acidoferrales bacterium]|nr:hypothetical protein [Candidatus Acidoferrales bacterium]
MIFDLISFLAGVIAGGLTGALAAVLYGLERTADIQEKLFTIRKELSKMNPNTNSTAEVEDSERRMQELRTQLATIEEEIMRMYRKT